jgi:hypothetical protein
MTSTTHDSAWQLAVGSVDEQRRLRDHHLTQAAAIMGKPSPNTGDANAHTQLAIALSMKISEGAIHVAVAS